MEAKRANLQTLHKGGPSQTTSPKTQVLATIKKFSNISFTKKTASDVSLTPSQAAEQAKLNARKNPLDALSRMSLRHQTADKRSGLQDVDDEYLKRNVFSKSSFTKHSGLNEAYGSRAQIQQHASGQPTLAQSEPDYKLQTTADGTPLTPSQAQLQAQQQQQQQQALAQGQTQQHQPHHQQSQQPPQSQIQMQPPPAPKSQTSISVAQMQCKNQSYKESHIIHNNAKSGKTGAESGSEMVPYIGAKDETDTDEVASMTQEMQNLQANEKIEVETHVTLTDNAAEAQAVADMPSSADEMNADKESDVQIDEEVKVQIQLTQNDGRSKTPSIIGTETISIKKPAVFKLNKQHTGMKNMSFGVGMAVTPTAKMEFDQETPEEFGVVKLNRPVGKLTSPPPQDNTDAMSTVSSTEGYTEQGYHDMKFFHNKLW